MRPNDYGKHTIMIRRISNVDLRYYTRGWHPAPVLCEGELTYIAWYNNGQCIKNMASHYISPYATREFIKFLQKDKVIGKDQSLSLWYCDQGNNQLHRGIGRKAVRKKTLTTKI